MKNALKMDMFSINIANLSKNALGTCLHACLQSCQILISSPHLIDFLY